MRRLFVRQAGPRQWFAVADRCPDLIVLGFERDDVISRLRSQILALGPESDQKRLSMGVDESELLIVAL
jgi:hypothetical protein